MNVAIIGTGRTGSKIISLLKAEDTYTAYNTKNKPSVEMLKNHDIAIVFVPGNNMDSLWNILIDSAIPVVLGSTGYTLPKNLEQHILEKNTRWVIESNFSIGILVIKYMLKKSMPLLDILSPSFHIYEKHHVNKMDTPSGTALDLKKCLEKNCTIDAKREGNEIGTHRVEIRTEYEVIHIEHRALNRMLFARGSLMVAQKLLSIPSTKKGIIKLESLFIQN